MMERSHERDTLQCRVKVRELRNANHKAQEANCHSGAAPVTCRFYKEMDAILEGDPTSTLKTTMYTSEPSSTRQEEESGSKGAEKERDSLASLDACSQELFSSQEEGSQLQRTVLGEEQTAEEVPEERQNKLQEYLAAKGKLKCPNTKPYLKDRTNQPNPQLPPLSKSGPVVQPKKDVFSKVSKHIPKDHAPAVKNTRSAGHALQHRKQLEQWLASKGKSYKRPPMTLPAKKPTKTMMNLSFWDGMEEEEEEKRKQLYVSDKINSMLAECLELTEKGFPSEELFTTLSSVPEAEKFAKFWICKAKLLARNGTIDMTGLYKAAVCAGAAPIQELREVVVEFLKNTDNASQGVPADPSAEVSSLIVEDTAEQPGLQGPRTPCPSLREQAVATPQSSLRFLTSKPVSLVKLQVVPVPRIKGLSDMQDWKFLTPVRRSLRIEHAISRYPEMLKEHDTVVSSLDEIMAMEDVSQFVFRKNEALLEEEDLEL
ncbi:Cytoskeleton-associated protein 2-like protein [Chelonia mydas]|uniref:Cytoskeleton-associated protein 2-like protein n=1 Tax=Chelonia mydas TaxID=8469 RepID=M7AZ33_CHEMY|nr:Cytoskeleton-associated protein 2-like protein [Chelonia mydas]